MSPRSVRDDDSTARTNQTRRRFLLGAGALTAALAGCIGDDDDDSDDDPTTDTPGDDSPDDGSGDDADDDQADAFDPASELAYGKWLSMDEDTLFFAYANLEALPEDIAGGSSDPSIDDPLVLYPLVVGGVVVGLGQLSLPYAGLARAANPQASADSTVRELTVVNRTIVAEGSFATDQLEDRLTEPTDETFGVAHERTGTIGEYDRYEPVEVPESVENAPAVAVTDETVVVGRNADRLEQTIGAGSGDRSRVFETDEIVRELLEGAGTGDLVIGQLGVPYEQLAGGNQSIEPDPGFEPQSDEDLVASIAFDADSERLDSEFGLAATDLGEDRQETIEASFGTAAVEDSGSVTVSDDRVTASGTYEAEQLTGGTTEQELSPATAAELVSPDALTLQYEPPRGQSGFGELWVTVTEDTDAAAIRVETDSGNANEIEPQDGPVTAGTSVAAPVDPDGDAVTVLAVNDEGAAGELVTRSVPTTELSETAAGEAVPEEALSFSYESPETGDLGGLTVEVVAETDAETLIAQPQEAPSLFTDRVGSLTADGPIGAGTTLETSVETDGDEVVVYATVDGATGEVARWTGPE